MKSRKKDKLVLRLTTTLLVFGLGGVWFYNYKNDNVEPTVTSASDQTTTFIQTISPTAIEISKTYDLYASVLLAQAILESSSGQSDLSKAPNYNLFGIKGEYKGKSVQMPTLEGDGKGNMTQIQAPFRAYPNYSASLYDYAELVSSQKYASAWKSNTSSYKDATAALTGLYATDTAYASKLNQIIETYSLDAYDK
ncbi:TPA: glycoside hydrolase family 73 protein [Streptococcus agalactiae]|nr:glycoside hydrolase family 73 protein [Streptococcus agalactiae]HEO6535045.1 glycoside hydrolase family 73 protein [Streptococcus agalactiae]